MTAERWFATEQLRSSDDEFWIALRRLLSAKGVEPETSLLDSFPDVVDDVDGTRMDAYHCVLVTRTRRVFVFRFGLPLAHPSAEWVWRCSWDLTAIVREFRLRSVGHLCRWVREI